VRSSAVDLEIDRPTPPFWGTKILKDEIVLEDLFWYMDLQAPDIVEIVDRSIQTTEQKILALKRSIQEITQEWRLS
jgi:5-methyltetrahydrofolate--homocysteine methyltransferase